MNIHDNMNIFSTEFIGKVLKNRSMDQCFLNNKHSGYKKLDPPKHRNVIRVNQFLCKMLHFWPLCKKAIKNLESKSGLWKLHVLAIRIQCKNDFCNIP